MSTASARPVRLAPPLDPRRDHVLGDPGCEIQLVEYGSYACKYCHAAHGVIANLRDRLGGRFCYVFRQLPIKGSAEARPAAELAEQAAQANGGFWGAHDMLMRRGPTFAPHELEQIRRELGLPARESNAADWNAAVARVDEDVESARQSGVHVTPTFFINGRRYDGAWDEHALAEAMLQSLGHRLHTATLDFVHWGPSAGVLLALMTLVAIAIANSPWAARFNAVWDTALALRLGRASFALPLIDWVNDGLLTIFFLVVGLEIKRELTVGRLSTWRAAALPIFASLGGMLVPALFYLVLIPPGPLSAGWGTTISTDTAFAVALVVALGERVPVDLRVFLTAAVIVDDLVAIAVLALFYTTSIEPGWLLASGGATALLFAFNRSGIYRPLPYAVVGVILWATLHEAGLHPTLAGVLLAAATPTRPPPNLSALSGQAQAILDAEVRRAGEAILRHGVSEPALEALDAIHDRIESPANKLLRSVAPWSSYLVLPFFALANAGVAWSSRVVGESGRLVAAIVAGLVLGKPVGIFVAARLAVLLRLANKPSGYSWRQLAGAGALAGIGFTVSLFIARQAFQEAAFSAARIAILVASVLAGGCGVLLLYPRGTSEELPREQPAAEGSPAE